MISISLNAVSEYENTWQKIPNRKWKIKKNKPKYGVNSSLKIYSSDPAVLKAISPTNQMTLS